MPEIKADENLNNGSPEDGAESRKGNNDADDSKELADGEINDMSGDESKPADAPETIDLGELILLNRDWLMFILLHKFWMN